MFIDICLLQPLLGLSLAHIVIYVYVYRLLGDLYYVTLIRSIAQFSLYICSLQPRLGLSLAHIVTHLCILAKCVSFLVNIIYNMLSTALSGLSLAHYTTF